MTDLTAKALLALAETPDYCDERHELVDRAAVRATIEQTEALRSTGERIAVALEVANEIAKDQIIVTLATDPSYTVEGSRFPPEVVEAWKVLRKKYCGEPPASGEGESLPPDRTHTSNFADAS